MSDVLKGIIEGWRDQQLVIGEDGIPAEFEPDAFAAMLGVTGAAQVIYQAYLKALLAAAAPTSKGAA